MTLTRTIALSALWALSLTWIDQMPVAAAEMSASTRAILSASQRGQSRAADYPYQSLIIQISSDDTIDQLLSLGCIIYRQREDMLLTSVPVEMLTQALYLDGVKNVQAAFSAAPDMNMARPFCEVDAVQSGSELPQGYDGTGIIAGFSDIGFDAQHIAFKGRIGAIYDYDTYQGIALSATTAAEIKAWVTDDNEYFHATHVANIMAGGYLSSPYYGVATNAEIVATTSQLADVGILCGVEDILQYAREAQKPAVVNLSLGSYTGPHDGTDLMCRYLSLCAEEAIICLSSGNYGYKNISASWDFTTDDPLTRVMVMDNPNVSGLEVYGLTDVWGHDNTLLSCRIEVYDNDEKELVYTSPWIGGEDEPSYISITSDEDTEWGQYLTGSVDLAAGIDDLNNRYNACMLCDITAPEYSVNGAWSRYRLGIAVKGAPGTSIDIYSDGSYSLLSKPKISPACTPSPDQSISNLCTAEGIISVGSCNSRNSAPLLGGNEETWSFDIDQVSNFTSYGNSFQGEALPHFCAPGNYVVSAMSTPYLEYDPRIALAAVSTVYSTNYYWISQCGTSMASPFAAGVMALWLQADPTLTGVEAREIAQMTAKTDYSDITNPKWGAGCIDALAGLRYILDINSVSDPSMKPIVTLRPDRTLEIYSPYDNKPKLYTLSGSQIDYTRPLAPGVYILSCPGSEALKIVVK